MIQVSTVQSDRVDKLHPFSGYVSEVHNVSLRSYVEDEYSTFCFHLMIVLRVYLWFYTQVLI